MFDFLFWLIAIAGGILQIVVSIHGKTKFHKFLPMGVWGIVMVGTLVFGSMFGTLGIAGALILVWSELKVLLVMAVAFGLVELVRFTK